MSPEELEKLNLYKKIRKIIALILTEFSSPGYKPCFYPYGIVLYDKKNQIIVIMDKKLN